MSFFGGTISKLEQGLNYASLKNQTISNNIANIDTPNYKAKKVAFQNVFKTELNKTFQANRTHEKHVDFSSNSSGGLKITQDNTTSYNHNGNNVDIDKEMTDLAKNQIYYEALIDRMNGKFKSMENVIRGGR